MAGYIKYDTSIQGILYNNLLKTEMQVDIYWHREITALSPNILLSEKYRLQKTSMVYVYVCVCLSLSIYLKKPGFTLQC